MSKELNEYLKELFKKEETDLHPVYAKILRNEKLCVYDQIIIKQALTPPTEEEVCKALGEYLKTTVFINDENDIKTKRTIDNKTDQNMLFQAIFIAWLDEGVVRIFVDLPPNLITMISRFYEGKVKE